MTCIWFLDSSYVPESWILCKICRPRR